MRTHSGTYTLRCHSSLVLLHFLAISLILAHISIRIITILLLCVAFLYVIRLLLHFHYEKSAMINYVRECYSMAAAKTFGNRLDMLDEY